MSEMRKSLGKEIDTEKLKRILAIKKAYNRGDISLEEGRKRAKAEVGVMYPYEFALAEQELKTIDADECRKEDIQAMTALFQDVMDTSRPALPEGHPIAHYYQENDRLKALLLQVDDLVQYPMILNQWLALVEQLLAYKTHFQRKQNQLYATLERHGFDRPSKTMWLLDDFVRDEINEAYGVVEPQKALAADDEGKFIELMKQIAFDLRDLMDKEETVLYPTSLALITEAEFEEMKEGDQEIGFAWLEVKHEPQPKASTSPADGSLTAELLDLLAKHGLGGASRGTLLDVTTGRLTLEQINLIYQYMPVDFTFVDENDIVRFYTDTTHRVFPRSKNIIGRKVENCHPQTSVHVVLEIVEKFKSGAQDKAEFWIDTKKAFIYICYFAVRDKEGQFRGILEMMQDCTHIRSLQGSRTLLTWDAEESKATQPTPKESAPAGESAGEETAWVASEGGVSEELKLEGATKLKEIFDRYPAIKAHMPEISPSFKKLLGPLGRVMIPRVSLQTVSEHHGMSLEKLIEEIRGLISKYGARS